MARHIGIRRLLVGATLLIGTVGAAPAVAALPRRDRARQDGVLLDKPTNLTVEQAATVPVAAFTALQALRDKGHSPGWKGHPGDRPDLPAQRRPGGHPLPRGRTRQGLTKDVITV